MIPEPQNRQKLGVSCASKPMYISFWGPSKSIRSATQYVGSPCDSPFFPSKHSWFVQIAMRLFGDILAIFRPTALTLFSHGLNFLEVVRPAFGGFLPATATEGNGGLVFSCHAERLQKPLAVCQVMARESAHGHGPRLAGSASDLAQIGIYCGLHQYCHWSRRDVD